MTKAPIQDEWPELATYCWGCGKNNTHGLQLKSYWEDEETVATFIPKEHHLAFPGILNGGIISTIIDCHGTGTANAYAKARADDHKPLMHVTASLTVKFLRPTPLDRPLTLRGRVTDDDGRKITVSCSLYADDTLCATGEVVTVGVNPDNFVKRSPPTFV
ncbi:PaaI family thioesterase [Candidatus Thorarchaeota archaeon]|nr:MAG: PaaI family thioesterase [Candidatus Thorarchaeota archaeon]